MLLALHLIAARDFGIMSMRPRKLYTNDLKDNMFLCSKFFRQNYAELKMLNPCTPFVYREAEAVEPFVYARYGI